MNQADNLWDRFENNDLDNIIKQVQEGDQEAKATLSRVVLKLSDVQANKPKLQIHKKYDIPIGPDDVVSKTTDKIFRSIHNFRPRTASETKKKFKAWLAQVVSSCYFDLLRSGIRKRTPRDWKRRIRKEITNSWLLSIVKEKISSPWKEIGRNNRTIRRDYSQMCRDRDGRELSIDQVAENLSAKIKKDARRITPAVFMTSNYQATAEKRKKPLLFLDDTFSCVYDGFVNLINSVILPVVKTRIGKSVLIQEKSLLDRSRTKKEEGYKREAQFGIFASSSGTNIVGALGEAMEPHKVMVFMMNRVAGLGVDEIIKIYSFYTLDELYNTFTETCCRVFEWDDDDVLAPMKEKLTSPEERRRRLDAEDFSELGELPTEETNENVHGLLEIEKAANGIEDPDFDKRPIGEKLLGEFLVRKERGIRETKSFALKKARNRIQSWTKSVQTWLRRRFFS